MFGVWGFVFVFFQSGQAGPYTLPCSRHILSPLTPGASPAKKEACETMSEADGLKGREGAQTYPMVGAC